MAFVTTTERFRARKLTICLNVISFNLNKTEVLRENVSYQIDYNAAEHLRKRLSFLVKFGTEKKVSYKTDIGNPLSMEAATELSV